jgi:hypothetical protein
MRKNKVLGKIYFFLPCLFLLCACNTLSAIERPPLVFSPDKLPNAHIGQIYHVEIQLTNAKTPPFYFYVIEDKLPEGLEFTWEDRMPSAILEGTPEESGTFTITLSVGCLGTNISGQVGSKKYLLIIEE